jgi:hypothetical protein
VIFLGVLLFPELARAYRLVTMGAVLLGIGAGLWLIR